MSVTAEEMPQTVGRRVRVAREDLGWTLDRLAEASGVSRRMIVNVEAGRSNASIATLLRLANALGVSLADLVAESVAGSGDDAVTVSVAIDREPLWRGELGGTAVMVASADTPDMLELWQWRMHPGEEYVSIPHRPGTRELLHVISGSLRLTVDGVERVLRVGDAASFSADVPHAYACAGRTPVRMEMTVYEPILKVRP